MSVMQALLNRSNICCELCKNTANLDVYEVPPTDSADSDKCILVCALYVVLNLTERLNWITIIGDA
jgi:hypothetical protein